MDTQKPVLSHACRAAACALAVLLSACGGGGGAGAPEVQASTAAAAPASAAIADQSAASGANPMTVPSPPDMSIAPPAPDTSAKVAASDPAAGAVPATTVTLGDPVAAPIPEGATACQPSICPAFAVNGSITNTQGAADPTAAHAYLLPAGGASGAYPDLARLPTLVLPPTPVTVGEAPLQAPQ